MKLYIDTKLMIFDEDNAEHEIILKVSDKEFYGYDIELKLSNDDQFIQDTLKVFYKDEDKKEIDHKEFAIREEKTWNSFPLYEIIDGKIIKFDYIKYQYFADTNRRIALAFKINDLYNPSAEAKIQRKAIKTILDHLGITDEKFEKYYNKVEKIINKNPKN